MKKMIESILPVIRSASDAVMTIYASPSFESKLKEDNSPLTEADTLSNEIIAHGLQTLFPDIPIISEETRSAPYETRKQYKSFFLVDPLDGTKEFIGRNDEFTINIAYVEEGFVAMGMVFVPVSGICYCAYKSEGAFKIDKNGSPTELRSVPFSLMDDGITVVTSRSHMDPATEALISKLQNPVKVVSGSSLKMMMIAEGQAHFYPRLGNTMEWDTAASQCIVEEAGGSMVRFDDFSPLRYNKEDLLNPHFIAFGALMDPESLTMLK